MIHNNLYHITMATILRTASFRLWQKFTNALPFGPILPNIIPVRTQSAALKIMDENIFISDIWSQSVHDKIHMEVSNMFFTHCGRKNNNPKDIHSIACSFPCAYEHIRGRSQVKGEVLDVSAIIVLDTVDERSPRGGLWLGLTHRWLGFHNELATCSILLPGNRNRNRKRLKKKLSLCVCKCHIWCQRFYLLKRGLDQIRWEHVAAWQKYTITTLKYDLMIQ